MSLSIDPFFFKAHKDVEEIAQPFLKQNGLNFFQFSSVFKDGSTIFLANHLDFMQARADGKRRVLSHIDGQTLDSQNYMFFWNGNLPEADTRQARDFDIDNGLCFVERYGDYYNLVAFGAPCQETRIVNFYINNIYLLKNFIMEFKDRARSLISLANQKRIHLPEKNRDVNTQRLLWAKSKNIELQYVATRFL